MKNLFSLKYWFNLRPEPLQGNYFKLLLGFLVLLIVGAVLFHLLKKKNSQKLFRQSWQRLSSFCVSNVIIGLIVTFFSYEMIPFLSARFWLGLWAIEMAIWLGFIGKQMQEIPKIKQKIQTEQEYKKYIP